MDVQQSGVLFAGVEYAGKVHRDFTIRALRVRDAIKANEMSEGRGPVYANTALLVQQLEKLGDIPKEAITMDILEDLFDEDMLVFEGARLSLQKKIRNLTLPSSAKPKGSRRRPSQSASDT